MYPSTYSESGASFGSLPAEGLGSEGFDTSSFHRLRLPGCGPPQPWPGRDNSFAPFHEHRSPQQIDQGGALKRIAAEGDVSELMSYRG